MMETPRACFAAAPAILGLGLPSGKLPKTWHTIMPTISSISFHINARFLFYTGAKLKLAESNQQRQLTPARYVSDCFRTVDNNRGGPVIHQPCHDSVRRRKAMRLVTFLLSCVATACLLLQRTSRKGQSEHSASHGPNAHSKRQLRRNNLQIQSKNEKRGIHLGDEHREGGGEADEGPEAHDVDVRHPPEVGVLRRRDQALQPDHKLAAK